MSEISMVSQAEIGKIQPKVEQKPTVSLDSLVESVDATYLSRLKNLIPEKARHALRLSTQQVALSASAFSILISSGCGNIEQERTPLPIPTPAVSEQPTGMPSAAIKFTRTPPPTIEISSTPSSIQEAPSESPQSQEQQESKELVSYTPSITILDAAPSVLKEGIIQKEFISNDEMIRNILLGEKYTSKEVTRDILVQEYGEEKAAEYEQMLVALRKFTDIYFNHGEDVANVVENTLEKSGLENTDINMTPIQKIFDKDSVELTRDPSGRLGISVNFDEKRIIKQLEGNTDKVINFSFQVGNVEFFEGRQFKPGEDDPEVALGIKPVLSKEDGNYKAIPTHGMYTVGITADELGIKTAEDFLQSGFIAGGPSGKGEEPTFIYYDSDNKILGYVNGKTGERVLAKDIPVVTQEELDERWDKARTTKSPDRIVGAYDRSKADENLPKLFEVAKAYPDKLFVVAGGNEGEDIREAMEKLSDERPSNLIIVAEWDGKEGKPRHDMYGADIYVDNNSLGLPEGSSFSTPKLSAEIDTLLYRGFSREQAREKIFSSSDTHPYAFPGGAESTARVFNTQLLENK